MTTGAQLRDQGIADVLAADASITRDYASLISEAVDTFAGTDVVLDSEVIRGWIEATHPDAQPHHPNVLGGALKALAESGRLVPVGWREASRPSARGRVLRTWRSP